AGAGSAIGNGDAPMVARRRTIGFCCLALIWSAGAVDATARAEDIKPVHALTMYGPPKYPATFTHFDYVNPDAPKGGDVRYGRVGSFDSLNPFILKGVPAGGVGMTFDTLMVASDDEPSSWYGLLAETMEMPEDRSWVIFNLRPNARFRDGSPVTAADI